MEAKDIVALMKEAIKKALEEMIRVEREEYLRQHPQTKANGYYERELKTAIGTIEGLKVARSRDSGFHSALLPYRASSSIELSELIMALFAVGVSTRKISHLLQLLRPCVSQQPQLPGWLRKRLSSLGDGG